MVRNLSKRSIRGVFILFVEEIDASQALTCLDPLSMTNEKGCRETISSTWNSYKMDKADQNKSRSRPIWRITTIGP